MSRLIINQQFKMNLSRNGGIQSNSSSFKSSQSYQNYQPHYFGSSARYEPKRFTSFNSAGLIQNSGVSDLKMFPTATSMKSIPEVPTQDENKLSIFKNLMLIAAKYNWTQNDIANKWNEVSVMFKNGFQGSKKEMQVYLGLDKTLIGKKRSKSQQENRENNILILQVHPIKQSPKLQKFHSLKYDQPRMQRIRKTRTKAKSVEVRNRAWQPQPKSNQSKQQGLIKLCQDIEFILAEGEKRLSI